MDKGLVSSDFYKDENKVSKLMKDMKGPFLWQIRKTSRVGHKKASEKSETQ